ncbi:MAG TPA: nucleotidyltransferase domain-containing protein [Thermoanaerobaculia bacterium]|nr:nucleotidyltransferase domain-containing protein [Thermoanaerobaculia bacterium]
MRTRSTGKPIDVAPYLPDLRAYLEGLDGLVAAWIYGSYGTPLQTPLSDLDLALLFRHERVPDFAQTLGLNSAISGLLHENDVSVAILNRLPVVFQHRVLKTGRQLLCREPEALADFVENVLIRHSDYVVDHERFLADYDRALVERYAHDRG